MSMRKQHKVKKKRREIWKHPPLHLRSNSNKAHTAAQRQQKAAATTLGENLARLRCHSLPSQNDEIMRKSIKNLHFPAPWLGGWGADTARAASPLILAGTKGKGRAGEACLFPACAYGENFTLVNNGMSKALMFLKKKKKIALHPESKVFFFLTVLS